MFSCQHAEATANEREEKKNAYNSKYQLQLGASQPVFSCTEKMLYIPAANTITDAEACISTGKSAGLRIFNPATYGIL